MDVNYNIQSGVSIPLADIVKSSDNYIKFANGTYMIWGKADKNCAKKTSQKVNTGNKTVSVTYTLNDDKYPGFKLNSLDSYEYFNISVNSISFSNGTSIIIPNNEYWELNPIKYFNKRNIFISFKSKNTSDVEINEDYSYDINFWFFAIGRWK